MDEPRDAVATDGSRTPAPAPDDADPVTPEDTPASAPHADPVAADATADTTTDTQPTTGDDTGDGAAPTPADGDAGDEADGDDADDAGDEPDTLRGHVRAVIADESGTVRLLDADSAVLGSDEADAAFDLLVAAESTPAAVVLDGTLDQRTLDVAAQRGVEQVVARELGEFTKRPTGVRLRTASALLSN
jgi:hypothetical protein